MIPSQKVETSSDYATSNSKTGGTQGNETKLAFSLIFRQEMGYTTSFLAKASVFRYHTEPHFMLSESSSNSLTRWKSLVRNTRMKTNNFNELIISVNLDKGAIDILAIMTN